jgi:hypothetical protein
MRIYGLLFLLLLSLIPIRVGAIDPENMTPQEYTVVERNCKSAQQTLQRIQYVDPVARVNRGTAYNNVSKLMASMTSRAAFNAYSLPQLSVETEAIQDLRTQFAKDYTEYEIALRELINHNCANNPQEFYARLVDVRAKRSIVTLRVKEIDRRLDVFSANITQLNQLVRAKAQQ